MKDLYYLLQMNLKIGLMMLNLMVHHFLVKNQVKVYNIVKLMMNHPIMHYQQYLQKIKLNQKNQPKKVKKLMKMMMKKKLFQYQHFLQIPLLHYLTQHHHHLLLLIPILQIEIYVIRNLKQNYLQ